jgi:hypothetical protein
MSEIDELGPVDDVAPELPPGHRHVTGEMALELRDRREDRRDRRR